jgi:myo-inositol-1(or 4)-monophosphatase
MGRNPKGQTTLGFDVGAEEVALAYCRATVRTPLRILSEERGEFRSREDLGPPAFTLIVDPVDGSENFRRNIELTAFSVAVLPAGVPLVPSEVVAGLVGNVFTGTHYSAQRGRGATGAGRPLTAARTRRLARALVALECEFDRAAFRARVGRLLDRARLTRELGSSVASQMGVADGGIDAYVDVRGHLTPENFMAGALVIEEAGGVVTDARGDVLRPFRSMTDGYLVVASATRVLHEEVLSALRTEDRPR